MQPSLDTDSLDSFAAFAAPAPKRRRGRLIALGVVVAVVLAGGAAVAGADSNPARATALRRWRRAVDEVLHTVATVEPMSQPSVSFPSRAQSREVDVAVGDTVAVGDSLASLDTEALRGDAHRTQSCARPGRARA